MVLRGVATGRAQLALADIPGPPKRLPKIARYYCARQSRWERSKKLLDGSEGAVFKFKLSESQKIPNFRWGTVVPDPAN